MGLIVSRDDISPTEIQQFPVEKRFLKLPVEGFLKTLDFTPISPQFAMINAINNPKYRFVVGCLSRRTGKTAISNIVMFLVSMLPGTHCAIVAPNYSLANISWQQQQEYIKKFGIEVEKNNSKDREMILANGSSIRVGSATRIDSLLGRSYDLILFDETAITPSEDLATAFNITLMPTLDKTNSKAVFISTPRGKAHTFYEYYMRGFSDEFPNWCSIWSDYRENPRLSQDIIDNARSSMSKAEFAQEMEASFNSFEGQIYLGFDETEHIQDLSEFEVPSGYTVMIGVDHGVRDPTAMVVIAVDHDEDKYYILDEYVCAEETTAAYAAQLQSMIDRWNVDIVFVDSAAASFRLDLAYLYGITSNLAKKSVVDGIGRVASLIDNGKVMVHKECENVIAGFMGYRWDERNTIKEKPIHDQHSHIMDAVRYAIYSSML